MQKAQANSIAPTSEIDNCHLERSTSHRHCMIRSSASLLRIAPVTLTVWSTALRGFFNNRRPRAAMVYETDPQEASRGCVRASGLGSKQSIGMHFGTFQLTAEAIGKPLVDLERSA